VTLAFRRQILLLTYLLTYIMSNLYETMDKV